MMQAKAILFRGLRLFRHSWAWSLAVVLMLAFFIWQFGPALAINDRKPWGSATARLLTISNRAVALPQGDRKSTRLNSSHVKISYAVFCLKKKKERKEGADRRWQ